MVDVFISYSRADRELVQRLARAVEQEGYSVWWDVELPPHLSYGAVIEDKIASAAAAIVVWSASASASEWVRAEADLARGQKKLIQTSVDDLMPPMPFNQIQFASIGDWQGEPDHPGWSKVKMSLAALCGPRDAPAAPTSQAYQPPLRAAPAAPAPVLPPGFPPTPAWEPPSRPRGGSKWLLAACLAVGLLIAGGAIWYFVLRAGPAAAPGPAAPATAAKAEPAVPVRPAPVSAEAASEQFDRRAVIDDPDGYTNVRSGPSIGARIVARVEQGEEFATHEQDGEWWLVRTADGTTGYMNRSRIRMVR